MKSDDNIRKKRRFYLIIILILGGGFIFYKTNMMEYMYTFFDEYGEYVTNNIEHKATLFENIIEGICSGFITFGALGITIMHENKKDRAYWKKEREKEYQQRLLAVRPFLAVEVKTVSSVRGDKRYDEKDYIRVGQGMQYQYACISLKNNGYGKCEKITLDGRRCSVQELNINDKKDLEIQFIGLESEEFNTEFSIFWGYQDIFGNLYLQEFECCLNSKDKKLRMDIRKPLLKGE